MTPRLRLFYYLALLITLASLLGSLYFSEILHFPPCFLCWWQRVFLYPLVLLIPVAIFRRDRSLPFYVLPLLFVGGLISIYHNLLQWGVIKENFLPCTFGVSCTSQYVTYFGFLTIPLLALGAFVSLAVLMLLALLTPPEEN